MEWFIGDMMGEDKAQVLNIRRAISNLLKMGFIAAISSLAYAEPSQTAGSEVTEVSKEASKEVAKVDAKHKAENRPIEQNLPITAHSVVKSVQDKLLVSIGENRDHLDTEPDVYYKSVETVLDPVVDFSFIARSVMGNYSKQASAEQRKRFTAIFKQGLVQTYAKGMAAYADKEITILPPERDVSGQKRINVAQMVNNGESLHRVSYTMVLNRKGEWKLINVVLDGVNLGKTFRSQFAQAMKKSNGDMDKVIADWSSQS